MRNGSEVIPEVIHGSLLPQCASSASHTIQSLPFFCLWSTADPLTVEHLSLYVDVIVPSGAHDFCRLVKSTILVS